METVPNQLINSKYECHMLVRHISKHVFPELTKRGMDIKADSFSVIQPYTSGQCIEFICYGLPPDRSSDFNFYYSLEDVGQESDHWEVLPVKEGFLDIYYDSLSEDIQKELADLLSKAIELKERDVAERRKGHA